MIAPARCIAGGLSRGLPGPRETELPTLPALGDRESRPLPWALGTCVGHTEPLRVTGAWASRVTWLPWCWWGPARLRPGI